MCKVPPCAGIFEVRVPSSDFLGDEHFSPGLLLPVQTVHCIFLDKAKVGDLYT